MKFVAIIHRRLREGKTFEDYRRAWFHATGFGAREAREPAALRLPGAVATSAQKD